MTVATIATPADVSYVLNRKIDDVVELVGIHSLNDSRTQDNTVHFCFSAVFLCLSA
jgi:hypothetical protein